MKKIKQLFVCMAFASFALLISCDSIPADVKYTVISEVKKN